VETGPRQHPPSLPAAAHAEGWAVCSGWCSRALQGRTFATACSVACLVTAQTPLRLAACAACCNADGRVLAPAMCAKQGSVVQRPWVCNAADSKSRDKSLHAHPMCIHRFMNGWCLQFQASAKE
jgi:hypothetical protein